MKAEFKKTFGIHIDNTILMIILVGVFFTIFLVIISKQGFFKLDDSRQIGQKQVTQEKSTNENSSLEKYFNKSSQDSGTGNDLSTDSENCILFGENVREGTVNSNTVCVNEPER